jgi:hypothetical protein
MDESAIPWKQLDELYHSKWDLSKPILLENSPPEVYFPDRLYEQFSPHGEVRFIVLARSPCNLNADGTNERTNEELTYLEQLRLITWHFGKQVFVLRYEDVCTNMQQVAEALDAWLPGLGQIEDSAVPSFMAREPAHDHENMPVPTYCKEYALPAWPYHSTLTYTSHMKATANELLNYFGYSVQSE